MLDPITAFFSRVFETIGRAIGRFINMILWPFVATSRWYTRRGWILRAIVGVLILVWLGGYLLFFWNTQSYTNFNPDYVAAYDLTSRTGEPGEPVAGNADTCGISSIVEISADLIDFNVNENQWVPATLLSKLGFFGLDWKYTPFFDNKAAFQLGINQVLRRTSLELVDRLGRVRGTSQVDQNLQDARTDLSYDEEAWYWGMSPFGPQLPAWTKLRNARMNFLAFNERLGQCDTTFDARADNLLEFLDRVASDIGSTSDILRDRIEYSDAGWFDARADDRFWFSYGQLYAYYGILSGARADFAQVFADRGLARLWDRTVDQLRAALDIQPFIISNGGESAWIMPSHLATMGFYLLRVRSNLVEIRDVLKR
jgi:hypothetical protein